MIRVLPLVLLLAACGVDGPPRKPEPKAPQPTGLTISGTVEVGVSGGG